MKPTMVQSALAILGILLVLSGLALWSVPLAMIFAGVWLIASAVWLFDSAKSEKKAASTEPQGQCGVTRSED